VPPGHAASRTIGDVGGGLVDRDAELAELGALLERAPRRDGGALLFEGPAGIGKTALVERAEPDARGFGRAARLQTAVQRPRRPPPVASSS
jgi:hypothetical protein